MFHINETTFHKLKGDEEFQNLTETLRRELDVELQYALSAHVRKATDTLSEAMDIDPENLIATPNPSGGGVTLIRRIDPKIWETKVRAAVATIDQYQRCLDRVIPQQAPTPPPSEEEQMYQQVLQERRRQWIDFLAELNAKNRHTPLYNGNGASPPGGHKTENDPLQELQQLIDELKHEE